MSDEILSELAGKKKDRGDSTPTMGYQLIATMKDFKLSPLEWRRLSRFEKRALLYHRIVEQYYIDKYHEKLQKEREREQRQRDVMGKMPRLQIPRRR